MLSHYLKGTLFCDRCHTAGRTSRLIYTEATGRGGRYGYFLCRSRQEGLCDLPHLAVAQVEEAIAAHYSLLRVPEDFADAVRDELETTMTDQQQLTQELHTTLTRQLTKLEAREERLIDLAADGVLTRAKIQQRSNTIQLERTRIQANSLIPATNLLTRPGMSGDGVPRVSWSRVVGFSCHDGWCSVLELYRGEHAEAAVSAAAVVPDFEVVEDRVGEFDAGLPVAAVEQLDLHAGPEGLDHRIVIAVADAAHGWDQS